MSKSAARKIAPFLGEFFLARQRRAEAPCLRAETVSGPGGKARFLFAPLSHVNDLFAEISLFAALLKKRLKTASYPRAPAHAQTAQTLGSRNKATLPIPLLGIKPFRRTPTSRREGAYMARNRPGASTKCSMRCDVGLHGGGLGLGGRDPVLHQIPDRDDTNKRALGIHHR